MEGVDGMSHGPGEQPEIIQGRHDSDTVPRQDEMRLYTLLVSLGGTTLNTFPVWCEIGCSQDDEFG